jgi:hypothetical protein
MKPGSAAGIRPVTEALDRAIGEGSFTAVSLRAISSQSNRRRAKWRHSSARRGVVEFTAS